MPSSNLLNSSKRSEILAAVADLDNHKFGGEEISRRLQTPKSSERRFSTSKPIKAVPMSSLIQDQNDEAQRVHFNPEVEDSKIQESTVAHSPSVRNQGMPPTGEHTRDDFTHGDEPSVAVSEQINKVENADENPEIKHMQSSNMASDL